jgi:hypothetical protein
MEKEGTMNSDMETDGMHSFIKPEEENFSCNRECICDNCRRSSSPSCKDEANKEIDYLGKKSYTFNYYYSIVCLKIY